jgi:hypothetical protein
VSVWTLLSAQRSDREAQATNEARRWDASLVAACIRFLQSQSALMRSAQRAQMSGKEVESLDTAIERFEATFTELELVAPNELVKSAQMLWAQTVGTVDEHGFHEKWPRKYADDQRQAFLEQVRKHFGLPELYTSTPDVMQRIAELHGRKDEH